MDKKRPRTSAENPGPPRLERVGRPGAQVSVAPGASHGLAAPEVTFAAAIAASIPHSSTLAAESALHLYYLVAANQAAGLLTIQGPEGTFQLTFKKGVVEHARSTLAEQGLGRFLLQRGLANAEQIALAEKEKERFEGDLVSALAGLGLLNPADSFQALRDYGMEVVTQALIVETGNSKWEPGALPPRSSFPFGSRWALFCAAARRMDVLSIRRRIEGRIDRAVMRTGGRIAITDLKLTPQETRLVTLFESDKSIAELAAAHPNETDLIHRLALLLSECELVTFGNPRPPPTPKAAPPPPSLVHNSAVPQPTLQSNAATPPAASAVAVSAAPPHTKVAPPAAPSSVALDLKALKAFLGGLRDQDHFAVLGVDRNATSAQIKAAYFQLAKVYHPDMALASDPADSKETRAAVFARIGEAWGVLGDEESRARYLQELRSGGPSEIDVMPILHAEQIFQMATVLVKTRQYDEARSKLAEAIQLNPDEPEFSVWKAWVDFLLAGDKRNAQRASSTNVIEAALKKNSRCIPGYLFLGQMAKLCGDNSSAKKYFERGLSIEPRNPEFTRELKYLKR